MATTLIKNGTVITASDIWQGDVLIEGEKVSQLGSAIQIPADKIDKTIDATGKYVIPGGIDPHTHMDMPFGGTFSVDDFRTGTIAAAFGGTTTIVDFAIQDYGKSLRNAYETWMGKAEGKAAIDYGFHMIMREFNDDLSTEMKNMVDEGVSSFKLFMAYPGVFMMDDAGIFAAMQRSGEIGATICMHAENGGVIDVLTKQALAKGHTEPKWHALTRPDKAEAEATHRAICLAEMANVPVYIVHLSAAGALDAVTEARDRGVPAYAETCPQYLFLDYTNYEEPDFAGSKYVMSPPLRPKEQQAQIWRGLRGNDLQLVSTDHCPFCMKEKRLGENDFSKIPNGAPGVETRMSLLFDGGVLAGNISLNRWVEITSAAPAKIFGMYPHKGTIAPGADADIVVWDPEREWTMHYKETLHHNADYSPYDGRKVKGKAETVLSRGRVIIENDEFVGQVGAGKFLRRAPRTI